MVTSISKPRAGGLHTYKGHRRPAGCAITRNLTPFVKSREAFVSASTKRKPSTMRLISFTTLLGGPLLGQLVTALPSAGCSTNQEVTLEQTYNVQIGDRRYLLWFPINYEPNKPAPLVLSYHGGTRIAEEQQRLDLLSTAYFNKEYIMVYPNGVNVSCLLSFMPYPQS